MDGSSSDYRLNNNNTVLQSYFERHRTSETGKKKGSIKGSIKVHTVIHANEGTIKIQIWFTLIANLLLKVQQKRLTRPWCFSGLATTARITLMNYVDFNSLFNNSEKDWEIPVILDKSTSSTNSFLKGWLGIKKKKSHPLKISVWDPFLGFIVTNKIIMVLLK